MTSIVAFVVASADFAAPIKCHSCGLTRITGRALAFVGQRIATSVASCWDRERCQTVMRLFVFEPHCSDLSSVDFTDLG